MEKFEKYYKYGFFIAILAIIALFYKSCGDSKALSQIKTEESNLRKALSDTLHHFQTKEGDWGVEKRTLQTDISTLKDKNLNLTENQKALVKEVERVNKNATTIAAAIVQLTAEVKGLKNDKPVAQTDSSVQFAPKIGDTGYNPNFIYDISVFNVKPFELKKPSLLISNISLPNTQSINFNWKDDRKEGYPVSFSVINTNPYFKVNDIQSYAIPELKKQELKPNFWDKVGKFSKTTGGKIVFVGIGFAAGVALVK
jgi:hypothetical protein